MYRKVLGCISANLLLLFGLIVLQIMVVLSIFIIRYIPNNTREITVAYSITFSQATHRNAKYAGHSRISVVKIA